MLSLGRRGLCKGGSRIVAFVLLCLGVGSDSVAKKVADYVPPPYWRRFARSLFTIAPMALCAAIIPYLLMWLTDRSRTSSQKWRFFGIALALTFAAAIIAGTDAWNDEMWNPSRAGAMVLALTFPIAIVQLNSRIGVRWRVALALLALVPWYMALGAGGEAWQNWAIDHGLPASW
jgi:hypothetical protein